MSDRQFVPGLELSRGFFADLVEPLLAQGFPDLRYTAALIGDGSEVLGYDTMMSTDHHWGPRLMVFLGGTDYELHRAEIHGYLARRLPASYRGFSTNFTDPDPSDRGVQLLAPPSGPTVNHRVELFTVDGYFRNYLNIPTSRPPTIAEWLSLPFQKLRSIVSGDVFRDDLSLCNLRDRLAWYPRDVWLYLLGCSWTRIGQEEHLMSRAGQAGDELGSSILGARLVRDVMRVAFLLERQYPPYPKWFGTAFARLPCAPRLRPHLETALATSNWREREAGLSAAYTELVRTQQECGIAIAADHEVGQFWQRPFRVIHGEKIAALVFSDMSDEGLVALSRKRPIGNIDMISDNTNVLTDPQTSILLRSWYGG